MSRKTRSHAIQRAQVAAALGTEPAVRGKPGELRLPLGSTGTKVFASLLAPNDYSPDWTPPRCFDLVDKMRLSSATIGAALRARKASVRRASWEIEPNDEDPHGEERADALRKNLFHGQRVTWKQTLGNILLGLDYGHAAHEIVLRDAGSGADAGLRWQLDRLQHIRPHTIQDWTVSDAGDLVGIRQLATRHGNSQSEVVEIPAWRLALWTFDLEGSEYRGRSVLRNVYRSWYALDALDAMLGIIVEKRGAGVDVVTVPEDLPADKQEKLEAALRNLHLHEKQYGVFTDGMTFDIKGIAGQAYDGLPLRKEWTLDVLRALGQDWLGLSGEGSQAQHRDKTSMAMMLAEDDAEWVADGFNRNVIAPLWAWNFGPDAPAPLLVYRTLDTRDAATMVGAIVSATSAGILDAGDDEVKRTVRSLTDIADTEGGDEDLEEGAEIEPEPEKREPPDDDGPAMPPKPEAAARNGARHVHAGRRFRPSRAAVGPERFVAWGRLYDELEDTESAIVRELRPVQREITADLVAQAEAVFKRGQIKALSKVEVPDALRTKVGDVVTGNLVELATEGARNVRSEMAAQRRDRAIPDPTRVREPETMAAITKPITDESRRKIDDLLAVRGRTVADSLVARLEKLFLAEVLGQAERGEFDAATLTDFMDGVSDAPTRQDVRLMTSAALGVGRKVAAEDFRDEAMGSYYSTMLDDNVCPVCANLEGETFEPFSDEYRRAYPPRSGGDGEYPDCDGAMQCRCVMILTLDEEPAGA